MPKRKGRAGRPKASGPRHPPRRAARPSIPPIDGLVESILRGGAELLERQDPFDPEMWASTTLGTFYKMPIPLRARDELETTIGPAVVEKALRRADREHWRC